MQVAGVDYDINWRNFTPGKSVFFPCLDHEKTWHEDVRPVLKRLGLNVVYKGWLDTKSGIRGLRIWRV